MNKNRLRLPALGFIALCLLALLASALPAHAGEIRHLSAGISDADRQPHPEYPLKLVFALTAGNYLAGVKVSFLQGGKLVGTIDDAGPWLFVDLKPGSYTVEATLESGNSRRTSITVPGQGQKMVPITWAHE